MTLTIVVFGLLLVPNQSGQESEPEHAANPVYKAVCNDGLSIGETRVKLPAPLLTDGASADAERAALKKVAGSDASATEMCRDSISAPFILKVRDQACGDRGVIRIADLWFVVRAGLDEIDLNKTDLAADETKTVEAANMRFSVKPIDKGRDESKRQERIVHLTGRLLDRIHVEATDRIVASKSDGSWLIAAQTDPKYDDDKADPNRWYPIARKGAREEPGTSEPYPGGISYVKISRLSTVKGALLVESHFAFLEPKAWFDGAPILRSKFGVIAQDRIRDLRRELAKSRKPQARRSSSEPSGD